MLKKIGLIALGVVVLAAIGYGVWWFVTGRNSLFTSHSNGLKVGASINADGMTTPVPTSGGKLGLTLAGTDRADLNIADGSLASADTISMKKVESISGLPQNTQLVTGVELTPDGLWMDKTSQLKLTIPADQKDKKLIGFSFAGDGKDFHYYPVTIADGQAVFNLTGFSSYGILALQDTNTVPTAPSTIQKQAEQLIARIVAESQNGSGGINDDQKNRIGNILDAWFKSSVKPNLNNATKDADKIDSAMHEFIAWRAFAQFFGIESRFSSQVEESLNTLATAVKNASDDAQKKCVSEKDATKAVKLLRYMKITQLMGLEGKSGLTSAKIEEQVKKCVNFELKITTETLDGINTDYHSSAKSSGTIPITMGDGMKLSGTGSVTVSEYKLDADGTACTSNVTDKWPITIPDFSFTTSASGNKFTLQMDLNQPAEVTWECGADLRKTIQSDNASVTTPTNAWDFQLLHQDEAISLSETAASFSIKDWEIIGKGDVFAKKVYDRNKTVDFGLGLPNTYQEKTTLELDYKPIN